MAKKKDASLFRIGQVVFSNAGHDRGKMYVIIDMENDGVVLADGKTKSIEHPKKKHLRHVDRTNYISPDIDSKLKAGFSLSNEDIYKAIQLFEARCKVIGG